MPSSVPRRRTRKDPAARRAEIVDAAAGVALREGLECVTLRRVAEELDVRPGLISHYFPSADDLVAEAFGSAATAETDALLPEERPEGTPTEHLARFLARTTGESYDAISRLWINARHLSRYREALRERVAVQEAAWRARLEGLIRQGVETGEFRTGDPLVTTLQILVVLDGLGVDVNVGEEDLPEAVTFLAFRTAERELGLRQGTLTRAAEPGQPSR
ncbi:TetR family transcriptional regulator C-terminal domain-containing protein [Streptomyces pharetrae]|uniref:TetR/AcrR family transcriptional regulator n=1 Tax=Streptomyces pharetrae TaxID=291370 RepID=UPI0033508CEC